MLIFTLQPQQLQNYYNHSCQKSKVCLRKSSASRTINKPTKLENNRNFLNKLWFIQSCESSIAPNPVHQFLQRSSKLRYFYYRTAKGVDSTVKKDGPAGFRRLIPLKPEGQLVNGWVKQQKLKYKGLRGYSEEIIRNVSKQKAFITKYNKKSRMQLQQQRINRRQHNHLQFRPQLSKKFLQQISNMKDEFLKDREKRNLFLSYQGLRLDQYTRSYFEKVEDLDPENYIIKLGAFDLPINDQRFNLQTDWQVAKGRSLNSYEIEGETKRKQVLDFRKSLTNLNIDPNNELKKDKKFRSTLRNSQKTLMGSTLNKFSKQKKQQQQKQLQQFNDNLEKIIFIKTRRSQSQLQRTSPVLQL